MRPQCSTAPAPGDQRMPVGHVSVPSYVPPEVMTPAQAARLLQVDEDVVLEMAREGRLPGRRIGDEWRFSREALVAWLAEPGAG